MSLHEILVSTSGLSKKMTDKNAVDNVSVSIYQNIKTSIIGETGSGKSTFLKLIAGLDQADAGMIHFKGERVLGSNEKLIPGHDQIAYLSQHFELRNNYRVSEVLSYTNKMNESAAEKIYRLCDIAHLYNRWTDELSGGERQRIALARVLTSNPSLILLDEPYSNLDIIHKNQIKKLIADISREMNITWVLVSHDTSDIISWSDMVLVFKDGKIIQQDTPYHVYHNPLNEYCAGLLGDYQLLDNRSYFLKKIIKKEIPDDKRLLVRPSYFSILKSKEKHTDHIVKDIEFFGNYFIYSIEAGGETLRVSSEADNFVKGETIDLDFRRLDLFCI